MKTLYLDCGMGAAGDMISAALLELVPNPDEAVARLNSFGLEGVVYSRERVVRCGIAATRLVMKVHGEEEHAEGHCHEHHHHDHHHHHEHRSLSDVLHVVESLTLPDKPKKDVAAVYSLLANAESRAHGRPVGEVHFHEVGALDAIADIAAASWLVSELAPDEIVVSPINVGGGTVRCAHGTLPVPAPATAFLLEGVPAYGDDEVKCELCTPTGAALVRHFAGRFGSMPTVCAERVGHGAGSRDFEDRANVLRAVIGGAAAGCSDEVCEFRCSIDDMTGESVAFACERIFAAGALDVVAIPAAMKKGRPGFVLEVICSAHCRDAVLKAVFRHTSTLGVREQTCRRQILARSERNVDIGDGTTVRIKTAEGWGVRREKPEYDDVAAAARAEDASLGEIVSRIGRRIS